MKLKRLKQYFSSESEKEEPTRLEDVWAFEKSLLIFSGYYPLEEKTFFYWFRFFITTFFSFGQLTAMYIQVTMETELTKIIDTLYFCMTETAYICKLVNFALQRNHFRLIEKYANDATFNRHTDEQQIILNNSLKTCVAIAKSYRLLCLVVVSLMSLFPILDQSNVKLLPMTGWYPLDREKYYWVIYAFQTIALAISAAMNSCFDTLACACICVGSVQLDVLMENFDIETKEGTVTPNRRKSKISKIICANSEHHNDIFNYIEVIERTFSNGIFVQFLASIIVICMTGFQMLMISPSSVQFLSLISYFSCMMNQVALYCWYGHDVILKSSNVGKSCYMSKWYEYDIKDQKLLFFIMERAKRPLKLTAGKFFILSLETLMMIIRSSYSYFAVLRHMYSENDGFRKQITN